MIQHSSIMLHGIILSGLVFYALLMIVHLSGRVDANLEVKVLDPEKSYNFFLKKSIECKENDQARIEENDGLAHISPNSQKIIDSDMPNKTLLTSDVARFDESGKTILARTQRKISNCLKKMKNETNKLQNQDLFCFYMSEYTKLIKENSPIIGGPAHVVEAILTKRCSEGFKARLREALAHEKFLECLTQREEEEPLNLLKKLFPEVFVRNSNSGGWGIHAELGFGGSFGFYAQKSNGIAWNFKTGEFTATTTTCTGVKFDISAGIGFSLSYMPNMDDLLGDAMTIEVGFDLPFAEAGFDVLLHYAYDKHNIAERLIGIGFAFGIGFGVVPIDFAASRCHTKMDLRWQHLSGEGAALINTAGDPFNTAIVCNERSLGVSDGDKVCCPETNRANGCTNEYCLFDGRKCPRSPAAIAGARRDRPGSPEGKANVYTMKYIIKRTFCPHLQIMQHVKNLSECQSRFQNDTSQVYMVYKKRDKECWFSNKYTIESCIWVPSRVSKTFFELRPPPPGMWFPHGEPYPRPVNIDNPFGGYEPPRTTVAPPILIPDGPGQTPAPPIYSPLPTYVPDSPGHNPNTGGGREGTFSPFSP